MEWKGVVEGLAVNMAKRNVWRFHGQLTIDDLVQEAYLIYDKVRKKYETQNDRHFIALFKRVLSGKFHDLAKGCSRISKLHAAEDQGWDRPMVPREPVGELDNGGAMMVLLKEMPDELKGLLAALLSDLDDFVEVPLLSRGGLRKRETTRGRSKRLFTSCSECDLRSYFVWG